MSDPRATIAFAIPELDFGGPDRVFNELLLSLPRDRFRLALITASDKGRYFEALPADIERHVLHGAGRYPVRRFAQAVDRFRPDLLFTTLRMNVTAGYARFLQRRRVPLVARQANAIGADFRILRRKGPVKYALAEKMVLLALRQAEVLVAQSQAMGAELAKEARPRQEIAVIGNPVSLAALDEQAARPMPPLAGSPAIVSVGRLAPQKGYDLLLPALARVRAEHPDAALTIIGDGPDREALQAQARELGLGDVLTLTGPQADVPARIAGADLFVSSSRYEGFSNALLEAMGLGIPVAATDCPGATGEMVRDGETGMLAPAITVDAIADAMLRALAVPREALGQAARRLVASEYRREAIAEKYAALFERIVRK